MTMLEQATVIRDSSGAKSNTRQRVGNLLIEMATALESRAIGQVTMTGNSTPTVCANTADFTKVLGTTAASPNNNGFTASNNRLTYTGATTKQFKVDVVATVFCDHGSHTVEVGVYNSADAAVNTAAVGRVMIQAGTGKPTQVCATDIIELAQNDHIELHLRGVESAESYVVSNLNMIVTEA